MTPDELDEIEAGWKDNDPTDNEMALIAALREASAEVERLRAKHTEMNRRLTKAEAHVETTIEDCRRQGVSIGRGLANAGYVAMRARVEKAEAAIARVRALCDDAEEWALSSPSVSTSRIRAVLDGEA